jgi:enterochelin esterase family protein
MKKLIFAAVALLVSISASAQFQRTPTPNDNLVSVETNADGSVTFRIYAPKAEQVSLSGDIAARGLTFTKADNGVWSATMAKATPGAYRYTFVVDGITVFVYAKNQDVMVDTSTLNSVLREMGIKVNVYFDRTNHIVDIVKNA